MVHLPAILHPFHTYPFSIHAPSIFQPYSTYLPVIPSLRIHEFPHVQPFSSNVPSTAYPLTMTVQQFYFPRMYHPSIVHQCPIHCPFIFHEVAPIFHTSASNFPQTFHQFSINVRSGTNFPHIGQQLSANFPSIFYQCPSTFPFISPISLHFPTNPLHRGQHPQHPHPLHRLHHPKQCPPWMLSCCSLLQSVFHSCHQCLVQELSINPPHLFHHPLSLQIPKYFHQRPFISINFASFLSILFVRMMQVLQGWCPLRAPPQKKQQQQKHARFFDPARKLSFPFPLLPASSRDLNLISVACHAVSWHFPALPFAHVSSLHLLERPFTARTPFLQFLFATISFRSHPPAPFAFCLHFPAFCFLSSAFFMLFPLHFP